MTRAPAIIQLGPSGAYTAQRIKVLFPESRIHTLRADAAADMRFNQTAAHLQALFSKGTPIIGICAAGILVRCLGAVLGDKQVEPPVVAVAEDASVAVPLLGGHHGANSMARKIAAALGGRAAITTASDVRFGVALDDPPPGWRVGDVDAVKPFTAALLEGASCLIEGDAPWLSETQLPIDEKGILTVQVTEQAVDTTTERLVYHPATLAVGVGCARGTDAVELTELVYACLRESGLSPLSVAAIISIDVKADEQAVHAVAEALGVPARFYPASRLEEEAPRLINPSDTVFAEVGCHGVAEGAALAAAGPEGKLICPKRKTASATCAIARAPRPIEIAATGMPRGTLSIVGIGPGEAGWRTPEADAAIRQASDLVGYTLYLDLVAPLTEGKNRHEFPLGEEEARVRAALDLAAQGRNVALISSGDAGIYAMASLAFELLDREARADWSRIAVHVTPGISALQAAAARAGAPLGHDFCAISLSDLMTPWAVIERRIRAVAESDFVIAFYNPASQRRRTQLVTAIDILRAHRPADTPVIIARNLGRETESVRAVRLAELDTDAVDMLTLLLVGASTTRTVETGSGAQWVYTPRGYGDREGT